MLGSIGPMEIIIVLVIGLIVLGPKRLPDAGKSLGKGLREFKGAISGDNSRDDDHDENDVRPEHELTTTATAPTPSPRDREPVA